MKKIAQPQQHTSKPSETMLLDKGVVRRIYERRVRLARGRKPTEAQLEAAEAFDMICRQGKQAAITHQTANILRTRSQRFAAALLGRTIELQKGPYHRRWARRLRGMSFSREDAVVLAYGSFGKVAMSSTPIAVQTIITTDQKLVANFIQRRDEIYFRFTQMVQSLVEPYSLSELPEALAVSDYLDLA